MIGMKKSFIDNKNITNTRLSPEIIKYVGQQLASRTQSNKLPLDLKSIGHILKIHLLKVSFDLLLVERLGQWIHHLLCGVDSLHLDELLLKVFAYDVKPPLHMLELLVRLGLLSEGYGIIIITV